MNYILKDKEPVLCENIFQWAKWFEEINNRRVDETENNGVRVSTVFLGADHSIVGEEPLLFETMIFGGEHDQDMWRYATWQEAEKGHLKACLVAGLIEMINDETFDKYGIELLIDLKDKGVE